jgi:sugar O-acyltransferase (sialic acid O-acetyltransferase NeuD family)
LDESVQDLVIIGAGGFGREVLTWAMDHPASYSGKWRFKGFLDTRSGILDKFAKSASDLKGAIPASSESRARFQRGQGIIGDPFTYEPKENDIFLCAIGEPSERRRYSTPISDKGGSFVSLIHPTALVSAFVTMGRGTIVGPFAAISPDTALGDFNTINSYTAIAHDVTIGSYCQIDGHCLIAGRAKLGSEVKVHAGSIVTPDVEIGDKVVVGAGSVVLGKIPADITIYGNPAKRFDWRPM